MNSESFSDSEDESNLVIVTSVKPTTIIKQECNNDDLNSLYSDDVIDSLWSAGVMGRHGPEEILVSLWYFVSHYFGISSRTDHAKLCLGNVIIDVEGVTRRLIFNKNVSLNVKDSLTFTTRFQPRAIYEISGNKNRCPVTIFEEYLSHRPSNFSYADSPFYLQPDKSVLHDSDGPWYAAAGLGKNRIGALFNSALSRCGQRTIRHYNSRRQIIGDVTKVQPVTSVVKVVDNSPKIKLKICHLSSGNPTVTQTLSDESGVELRKPKLSSPCNKRSGIRKRCLDKTSVVKNELQVDISSPVVKREPVENETISQCEVKKENIETSMTKYIAKPTKRIWSIQKSIINITKKEANPILRQIMMQICMNKDLLLPSDKAPNNTCPKSRLLRRSVKLSHLQLPLWPTIDKFCDAELQKSMKYSFDDDNHHKDEVK